MIPASLRAGDSIRLGDVIVKGGPRSVEAAVSPSADITVVGSERIEENFRPSLLPTISEAVPGMFVTERGLLGYGMSTGSAGAIKIRGIGSMADLLVMVDGTPQYAGLYGHPVADALHSYGVERVEVTSTMGSAIYGSGAMGGVINVITHHPTTDGWSGEATVEGGSYGSLAASALARLKEGKFFGEMAAAHQRSDGHRSNMGYEQTEGALKAGYDFSPQWKLAAEGHVLYQESSNPGTVAAPILGSEMMFLRYRSSLSLLNDYGAIHGALRASYSGGHHHIDDGHTAAAAPTASWYLHNDDLLSVSLLETWDALRVLSVNVGGDVRRYGGHAWNRSKADRTETDITRRHVTESGALASAPVRPIERLSIDGALRYDYSDRSGGMWVPQGGVTLALPADLTLSATAGRAFRNPTLREMYMFRPANADLKPQQLSQYELKATQRLLDGRLAWTMAGFYIKARNMITTEMRDGRPTNINTGRTENSGFELSTDYLPLSSLRLSLSYAFLHTSRHLTAAPAHKLCFAPTFSKGRLLVGSSLKWISGLYTSTQGAGHKTCFLLWDMRAAWQLQRNLRLFARGDNLLARRYEINAGHPMPRATVMAGIEFRI